MSHTKPVIMAIDDNKECLNSIKRMLVRHLPEFDVVEFADPFLAIINVEDIAPDIILLDFMLNKYDGIQVLREIRRRGIQSPAVILTGYGKFTLSKRIFPENHVHAILDKGDMANTLIDTLLEAYHSNREGAMA